MTSSWQEWEEVVYDYDGQGNLVGDTQRMRVFGGYLYRERIWDDKWIAVAICFVPAFPAKD